ncbi:hypothetical protein Q3C01_25535 [Bradyrhizobium sp. UFLA05-109]
MPYETDRQTSDRFLPEVKRLISPYLLDATPDFIDQKQAADLMTVLGRDIRIGVRVRAFGYAERYPHQFTLRCQRDTGTETELSKIINGWGDWFFYGHAASPEGLEISPWWLIDLAAFRAALIREARNGTELRHGDGSNGDGTHFKWFDVRSFPPHPPLLIASSEVYFS